MKPFQVTFVEPDKPDFEITEIFQAVDGVDALRQMREKFPYVTMVGSPQQLHIFRSFKD